jgi:hypothetical protein
MPLSLQLPFQAKGEQRKAHFLARRFSSLDEILPRNLYLPGYPKSGDTWFQRTARLGFSVHPGRNTVVDPSTTFYPEA